MNILFLALDVDSRAARGDSVHVRELAANWASAGHSVRMVTADGGGAPPGVNVYQRAGSTLAQVRQCTGLSRRWADVVYERRLSPKVSWAVSVRTGIPFAVEINGVLEDEVASSGRGPSSASGMRLRARRRMMLAASAVVAVSRAIRDDIATRLGLDLAKVHVVANGANTSLFYPRGTSECRQELGLTPESRLVVFAGNLAAWQGVDILVRASSMLSKRIPNFRVAVVGDGPVAQGLRDTVRALGLEHAIRFVGAISYERVPLWINAADVCAAPFRKDRKASPIKVFEYLSCARPVAVSDVDEVGEFVRAHSCGLAVPPEDDGALAAALWELLTAEDKAAAMGIRGREAVMRYASWEATAKRVVEILEDARLHVQ